MGADVVAGGAAASAGSCKAVALELICRQHAEAEGLAQVVQGCEG